LVRHSHRLPEAPTAGNYVYTAAGHSEMVYILGSYQYGETGGISNGRGVVLSTNAGASFVDQTMDATDALRPNGLHPHQHFLVTNPNNPLQFFEGNDGGMMRSSGMLTDISSTCATRNLTGARVGLFIFGTLFRGDRFVWGVLRVVSRPE
jgi:hypothetical protein